MMFHVSSPSADGSAGGRRRYQPMAGASDPSAVRAADMAFGEEAPSSASYSVPKARAPALKLAQPAPVPTHARFSELYISRLVLTVCLCRAQMRSVGVNNGVVCCSGGGWARSVQHQVHLIRH